MTKKNRIVLDGKEIEISEETAANIRKSLIPDVKLQKDYVMIRTRSAGVFTGVLVERTGTECVLSNARRIWYWSGAASLSQLAQEGTSDPANCKFPCEVDTIVLTEVLEVIKVTDRAQQSIKEVKVWAS